jgi:hypothetical protein
LAAGILAWIGTRAAAEHPKIRFAPAAITSNGPCIEVAGIEPEFLARLVNQRRSPQEWTRLFAVYVDPGSAEAQPKQPAVLGSYHIERDVLRFEPRFALRPGLRYRAVFDPGHLPGSRGTHSPVVVHLTVPAEAARSATVVQQIYPSASRLPENQLKFYLHFSAPMSRGEAYRHIHLYDASGKEVELPFLELHEELWDPTGKRFTLFFDPGRIKRGLKPREEVGPVLEEGKRYTLVIDRSWPDARGELLKTSARKHFRVGPPDDQRLDPKTWKLEPPAGGSRATLTLRFHKPLDHALLEEVLAVEDSAGIKLTGAVNITDEERSWQFTPTAPWKTGSYRLIVATRLEDLAGNQIGRPFEIDVLHPIPRQTRSATVSVPFDVGILPGAK